MYKPGGEARPADREGWRRHLLGPWPAVLLGAACLVNSLANGFAYDDRALVVDNPRIRSLTEFKALWLSDWWRPTEGPSEANPRRDRLYRPLTLYTLALNHAVGGLQPFGYHLVNVLLHAAACGLVWKLARRLCDSRQIAAIAAALFAVHPVHVEAVANVVGRAEVLAALLMMGGLLILLPRDAAAGLRRGLLAAPVFLLALLAKETAVCFPAIALLVMHRHPRGARRPWRWWLAHCGIMLLPLLVYLPLRYVALEHRLIRGEHYEVLMNPLVMAEGPQRVWGALTVLGHYARLLIVPAKLSSDYGLAIVDPRTGLGPMTLLGLLAALALLAGLLGYLRRGGVWRLIATLTAILLASYALISNTVLLIGVSLAERLMYWPSVPVVILIGVGVSEFWRRQCAAGKPLEPRARLLTVLGLLVLLALGLRTGVRASDWRDNLTLSSQDVRSYPQGAHLQKGRALALMHEASDIQDPRLQAAALLEAEQHLINALEIEPAFGDALGLRARIRAHFLDRQSAGTFATAALLLEPHNHDALLVLSQLRGDHADNEQRVAALRETLTTRPAEFATCFELGALLTDMGKPAEARPHLRRAVALEPDNIDAQRKLGQVLTALGHTERAIEAFRHVLALKPDDWSTHANLASLLSDSDIAAAMYHAEQAQRLAPNDVRSNVNLAEVCELNGQTDRALAILSRVERGLAPDDPFRAVVQQRIAKLRRE